VHEAQIPPPYVGAHDHEARVGREAVEAEGPREAAAQHEEQRQMAVLKAEPGVGRQDRLVRRKPLQGHAQAAHHPAEPVTGREQVDLSTKAGREKIKKEVEAAPAGRSTKLNRSESSVVA